MTPDESNSAPRVNPYASPRWWAGVVAIWTAFALVTAGHYHLRSGTMPTYWAQAWVMLPFYWIWIPLTPLVYELAYRFDFRAGRVATSLAVHAAGALGTGVLHSVLYGAVEKFILEPGPAPFAEFARGSVMHHVVGTAATYLVVAVSLVAFRQYARAQDRAQEAHENAARASRLEAQLASTRLQVLQSQLRPHFLFNALNSISVLVLKGASENAIRAIRQLADLLRATLDTVSAGERLLEEELAFVREYVAIEQLRFAERLNVEFEVTDEARRALVPHFVLQPLVENAIVHGLRSSDVGDHVRIASRRDGDLLRIEVWDNGVGVPADIEEGVGISNARGLLRELLGERGSLQIVPAPGGGTVARIEIPFSEGVTMGAEGGPAEGGT